MHLHFFTKILLALLLVISLNELASRHYVRQDLSRSHRFSLSDQGSVLFSGIQRPAHMIIYFSSNSSTEGSELFEDLEALMQEYQIKGRENLIVEYLDPIKDLERARKLQQHYRFNPNENAIIIDYMDHTKIIPFKELGDYDHSNTIACEPPRLIAFRGEQVINAALIELSEIPLKKIYFLQGHGEKTPGTAPLEVVGRYLQHQHVNVQPLNLAMTNQQVPEDAALVMILGASYDLSQEEAEVLKKYWSHSGRLFVLLDPTATTPHLLQITQAAGILPRGDCLLSSYPSGNEAVSSHDVIGIFLSGCELTKQFLNLNIVFAGPTESLDIASPQFAPPVEAVSAKPTQEIEAAKQSQRRPLIEAAPSFWGCKKEEHEVGKDLSFIEGKDSPPPLIIAAIADLGALHDDRVAVSAARMIVVGNSDFIQDKNISAVDLDFFSSSLNGLIDRVQLTGNTAKMKAYFTLNLHEEQMQQIAFYCMLLIPLLGAVAGLTIFWRRRS
ncbi:MAG: GldG family protein [Chthoniobacterales bacterium]|nr:GldG family protein [Chthoniobacterales bacterium]